MRHESWENAREEPSRQEPAAERPEKVHKNIDTGVLKGTPGWEGNST